MLAPRCPSSQGQLKLLISILLRVGVATRHTPRKIATHRTSVCAMRFSGEIVDPARSTWKSIGRTARSDGVSLHASSMVIVLFCVLVVHKGWLGLGNRQIPHWQNFGVKTDSRKTSLAEVRLSKLRVGTRRSTNIPLAKFRLSVLIAQAGM